MDREKLRREAVRQLRRIASGAPVEELRITRRRGYSIDNGERDPNIRCVGVPVYNAAGQLVAGVSTSGPSVTMTDEKLLECAGILQNAALKMRERIYR